MDISFNFYAPKMKEKAPTLPNSPGHLKNRLHFFGAKENDRFAVAVSKQISSKTMPKLNWFEKKFYVLVPDPKTNNETWYKVNKNSLKKRFQITEKELKQTPILDLIQDKYLARKEWGPLLESHLLRHGPDSFPSRFIDALVNANIKPGNYKAIAFWDLTAYRYFFTSDGASLLDIHNYEKGQILSITYVDPRRGTSSGPRGFQIVDNQNKKDLDLIKGPNSPLTLIELNDAAVKTIIEKGEFPPKMKLFE